MAKGRGKGKKCVTCDDCYFRKNMLCALELDGPCTTFRPDKPDGLKPPQQLSFFFLERRAQMLYAFRPPN